MRARPSPQRRTLLSLALLAVLIVAALPAIGVAGEAPAGQGLLVVDTEPALDAQLLVDGLPRNVGSISGLPLEPGDHEVCFAEVAGYLPPPCETVTITEGQSASLTGTYLAAGTLEVSTVPSDLEPQLTIGGVPRDAGATVLPIAAGAHEVCAAAVPGYVPVDCTEVDVPAGGTASVELTFEVVPEPDPEPDPDAEPAPGDDPVVAEGRVSEGLVALYDFADGSGATVTDSAGVLTGMDLTIANTAATRWGEGTLTLDSPTIATTTGAPTDLYQHIRTTGEFTVETWIEPANLTQNGPARIASIGKDSGDANFVLGQGSFRGASDLIQVRHQRVGDYQLPTARGTLTRDLTHVVATSTTDGTVTVYLDGQRATARTMAGDPANWDLTHRLGIGNELDGTRPWLGTYHLLAIYDSALTDDQITTNHTAGPDNTTTPTPTPQPEPQAKPEPEPQAKPEPEPQAKPEPEPQAKPEPEPQPEPEPEPKPERKPALPWWWFLFFGR